MTDLSISKILMPVDFSARAEEAVRYAARLARHLNAELVLLHVFEPPHVDFAMVELPESIERLTTAQRERAQLRLEHFASSDLDGIRVVRKVSQGQPADEILAQANSVDLVVMPTQGHGRIREFLIGSVTAKVLHDCERPVLTGVHLAENPSFADWQVKNILCAIDFGPESENVLRWGARLAGEFGATVTVVHADSDTNAGQRLDQSIHAAGLAATARVVPGEPHRVIVATAQQTKADLVIIGRGSNTGALGRLRAQAYEIVRKSPCPVLSV
jgi:nucleotide-binding universal stress UspA family protein